MPAFSSKFHSVHSMSIILTYGLAYLFSSLFLESESKNCRFLARHSVCANIMFAFSIHVQATGQELKFCACLQVHSVYSAHPAGSSWFSLCAWCAQDTPCIISCEESSISRSALGVRSVSCSLWFTILALGVCKDCFTHLLSYARFLLVPCIALGVRSKSAFHASYT